MSDLTRADVADRLHRVASEMSGDESPATQALVADLAAAILFIRSDAALRAEVERLTRERNEADAEAQWKSGAMAAAEADAAAAREQVRKLREAGSAIIQMVEGISGAMMHGTWRAERSNLRMKDTDEWVRFYTALQGEGER